MRTAIDSVGPHTASKRNDPQPITWALVLREGGQMFVLCAVIAALIWFLVPSIGRFGYGKALLHSIAIGYTAWGLLGLAGRRFFLYSIEPRWLLIPIMMTAGVVAHFVGSLIARLILGIELSSLFDFGITGLAPTALLATAIVTVIISMFFFTRGRLADLRANAAEEAHRAEAARLAMLRAQIDPHMLFNTLSTLRALITIDPARATEMLDHLIVFMRSTLTGSRENTTTLADEFELLEHYLSLMAMRMGPRLSTELHLPTTLRDVKVPTLLLQPLVENAIRHGLEPAVDGGHIKVRARQRGDQLQIEVHDTGIGLAAANETPNQGTGFGLNSVRERLQAMYGEQASIVIGPPSDHASVQSGDAVAAGSDSGTVVLITFPIPEIPNDP